MVIYVGDVEIVLCTLIRTSQFVRPEQWPYSLSRFQIEAVITNKAKYLSIAIDAVVSKHFFGYYVASSRTLVNDILHKVYTACHINYDLSAYCRSLSFASRIVFECI